jgi:hypothetical protein
VVERLLCKNEALSSNPSPTQRNLLPMSLPHYKKKKKKKHTHHKKKIKFKKPKPIILKFADIDIYFIHSVVQPLPPI